MVLILAIILMLVLPGFWLSPIDVSEFDDWAEDAKSGDATYVTGEIEVKNETSIPLVGSIYQYKFKDADTTVLSTKDIGDKGDNVFVQIEIRELGPEVSAEPSWIIVTGPNCCCSFVTIIGVIIGIILLLIGLKKKKTPEEASKAPSDQQPATQQPPLSGQVAMPQQFQPQTVQQPAQPPVPQPQQPVGTPPQTPPPQTAQTPAQPPVPR